MDSQNKEVLKQPAQEEHSQEEFMQAAQEECSQVAFRQPAQEEHTQEKSEVPAQEEHSPKVVVLSVLQFLKRQLKLCLRQEIKIYHDIVDITRSIASKFPDKKQNKELVRNLNYELRLRSIVDYNVKLLRNCDNTNYINSAVTETEERKECFAGQYNFVTEAISYDQSGSLYPHHLLSMSYDRQRLLHGYIHEHKYKPQGIEYNHGSPRMKEYGSQVIEPDLPSSSESEESIHSVRYLDISESEEEYLVSPAPVPEQKIPDEDIDINDNTPAKPSSPKSGSGQVNNEHLEDNRTEDTVESSVVDPAFLAPGCSKWTPPFK